MIKFYLNYVKGKNFFNNNVVHSLFQRFIQLLNNDNHDKLVSFLHEVKNKHAEMFAGKRFISVDGVIGAGKTFIIEKHFKQGNCVIPEPIDLWKMVMCEKRYGFCKDVFTEFNVRMNKKSIFFLF
jgi:hypothetical protein